MEHPPCLEGLQARRVQKGLRDAWVPSLLPQGWGRTRQAKAHSPHLDPKGIEKSVIYPSSQNLPVLKVMKIVGKIKALMI